MTHDDLVAKVAAVNSAHKFANKLWYELTEFFRSYVGQKVLKQDGSLLAKIKLPELPNTVPVSVYKHTSDYSLAWTVKTCQQSGKHHCVYYETTVYIGDLSKGVLTKLSESYQDPPAYRWNYTIEEVLANQQAAKDAKEAYDEARSKCFP